MRRRLGLALTAAVVAAVALTAATVSSAAAPQTGPAQQPVRIDPSLLRSASGSFKPLSLDATPVEVMVQLATPPVAVQVADAHRRGGDLSDAQRDSIRRQIKAQQDGLKGSFSRHGARIVAQLQSAYNGVQMELPRNQIQSVAQLPGVQAVHAVRTYTVGPKNVNGVPFVNAPIAWSYHQTGRHVKIADIDTGIDYTHADFGGPGTTAAFQAAQATSTQPADPRLFGPRAAKVKGGYDFVGDAYDANDPSSVPQPDPNPLDCNGHGTHTAGTVAGFGVLDNGKTYRGRYDENTVASHDWNVGPGVAPEADIYAYRIFGCSGSSSVVDLAIDQAVADRVDVITMSLGSDLGGTDDPTTVAAENAAAAGITVVAAAGNAGPGAYIVSSPSTGSHVLSVAALDGSLPEYPGANVALSTGGSVDTLDANGAPLPGGSLPVYVLPDGSGGIGLGCAPADYASVPAGSIVITKRGTCARVARAIYGQQAGAAAVVMVNSSSSLPPYEGPITSNPDTGEPYDVTIPFLGAAGTAANVSAFLAADGGTATLSSITIPNSGYQHVASFSSGGPRNPDSAPKPEVIAPGVSVASAGIGTGNGFLIESGTSMATPMTAGVAALVQQAHPRWTGAEIKAALENTGDPTLNADYNVRQSGAGVVQADNAVASTVLATTDDGLDSLAFGYVPGTGDYQATKSFTLTNTDGRPVTYSLSVEADATGLGGGDVSVSPSTVTLRGRSSQTVDVTLTYSAGAFAALPSMGATAPGEVVSYAGAIVATPSAVTYGHGDHGLLDLLHRFFRGHHGSANVPAGPQELRVPFLVVPRGLSDVQTSPATWSGSTGSATVTNNGIHEGTADVYTWGLTDPNDGGQPMDIRDVGIQSFAVSATDRLMVFAINTWGQAANQSVNEYDIDVDTNGDGQTDYVVVGVDLGAVLTGSFNGQFGSFVIDAATGGLVDAWYATAPMNGSVVELPLLASDLGLSSSAGAFTYSATGFSLVPGTFVDVTGTASYDPFHKAVNNGQFADLAPGDSASIPLAKSSAQLAITPALGWISVNLDDANGAPQADEIPLP